MCFLLEHFCDAGVDALKAPLGEIRPGQMPHRLAGARYFKVVKVVPHKSTDAGAYEARIRARIYRS